MTLADDIAIDVTEVFLDTDDFAFTGTWYPKGNYDKGVTVKVCDFGDGLEGTREVPGDGRVLHNEKADSLRGTRILEMPYSGTLVRDSSTTETITITGAEKNNPDVFVFSNGEHWTAKRIISEDSGMMAVLWVRQTGGRTRQPQRKG